jgi:hypothetical protein
MSDDSDDWAAWLKTQSPIWKRLIAEGRLGSVLQTIEGLPPELDAEKPFLRIQMLHMAGLYGEALAAIKTVTIDEDPNPGALIKLSRIAVDGGGHEVAAQMLSKLIPLLSSQQDLEEAVIAADDVGDQQLQDIFVRSLTAQFPRSAILARMKARRAAAMRDYAGAAQTLEGVGESASLTSLYRSFATYTISGDIDYAALAEKNRHSPYWDGVGARLLVEEAKERRELRRAIPVVLSVSEGSKRVSLLLAILAASFLERGEERLDDDEQLSLIRHVVNYLADHPEQAEVRIRLMRILSPETSGTFGLPLIAFLVFTLAQELRVVSGPNYLYGTGAAADFLNTHMDLVRSIFRWLHDHAPIHLGRTTVPKELLTADADELAGGALRAIAFLGRELKADGDVETLRNLLALIVGISTHTQKKNFDLKAMRLVGGALANAGLAQSGRDIAETALDIAGTSERRRAMAWSAMADVYNRTGSHLESLIALACSFAASRDLDGEELWHGLDSSIRLFRDLHLFSFAKGLHQHATTVLSRIDFWASNEHRHQLLSLQIDTLEYLSSTNPLPTELEQLLARAQSMATRVMEMNDDAVPIGFVLSQLVQKASAANLVFDKSIFSAISERTGAFGDVIKTVSKAVPTASEVLAFHRRMESPRFAEDVALDQRQVGLVARRLLVGDNPEVATLAIELLADRSIAQPGQTSTARPLAPLADEGAPAAFARVLSKELAILMAAFDPSDRLISVAAINGNLGAIRREPHDSFSAEHFREWTKEFPYRYGIDATINLFHLSTEQLKVQDLPEGAVVLIAEPTLQQMPPNLFRVGEIFAGYARPMAAAPSLSWLAAARASGEPVMSRLCAWIPVEQQDTGTLGMLADRLRPTFEEYRIELDTSAQLPRSMTRSGVAIVAAHGSVGPDAEFFSYVSDEAMLRADSLDFTNSLSQVNVVILFVCSGGRLDRHPSADTTVGLAHQLLYRGSSTVIASPWPLDSRVTYHWLPEFLRSWKSGNPIVKANFDANLTVGRQLGTDPAKSLAMTVYGDPLIKFPPADGRSESR